MLLRVYFLNNSNIKLNLVFNFSTRKLVPHIITRWIILCFSLSTNESNFHLRKKLVNKINL